MLPAITGKFFLKYCLVQVNNDYKPVFLIVMGGGPKTKKTLTLTYSIQTLLTELHNSCVL